MTEPVDAVAERAMTTPESLVETLATRLYDLVRPECALPYDVAERAVIALLPQIVEECARVADDLGGDRVHPLSDGDWRDKEGRTRLMIDAQHVRAQSIATAIRQLAR